MRPGDFCAQLGIEVPLIGGPMYPCSNPELVAAVSEAGGIGIVQPLSLTFVHGHEFREGLRYIRQMTAKPVGMNVLIEASSKTYLERMRRWVDAALEEGLRFFVTSLGNPRWVVEKVHASGGRVFHDVTERRWALKALEAGVDGLIAVNSRAGGHAGTRDPRALFEELQDLKVPLVCAGGVGDEQAFAAALALGYAAAQVGTRFIATAECRAHDDYKQMIVQARAEDVVLTERLTGVPVAVIQTPWVKAQGLRAGWLARKLLQHRRFKHWVRLWYSLRSFYSLKKSSLREAGYANYYQAGKSVEGIEAIEKVSVIVDRFREAARPFMGSSSER